MKIHDIYCTVFPLYPLVHKCAGIYANAAEKDDTGMHHGHLWAISVSTEIEYRNMIPAIHSDFSKGS